jgi:hypothetical protein
VLIAVSAAVIIEMANCITVFQKFLFFIVSKVLRLIKVVAWCLALRLMDVPAADCEQICCLHTSISALEL